jgi:DNA-binding XRE family transcriptional regulator
MTMSLKEHRERSYLTTRELAEKAGIQTSTLYRIEYGKVRPHITTMRRIASALGVKPDEIAEFSPAHDIQSEA